VSWINIKNLKDNEEILSGTAFHVLSTKKGREIGHWCPKEGYKYMLIDLPGEYMWLGCFSAGKEGNVMLCKLKKSTGIHRCVLGKEVKRMLLDDIQEVLINKNPHYTVD